MVHDRSLIAVSSIVILLAGCSSTPDLGRLQPSRSSSDVKIEEISPQETPAAPSQTRDGPPKLGDTNFKVPPPQPGEATGTYVGQKVIALRNDLKRLLASVNKENADLQTIRQQTVANARRYHEHVAGIRSRLQLGTTPGNPHLLEAWNQSQSELEAVNADIGQMNALSNRVASDAAMSGYLLESTRASFNLSGAIDEDHQQLTVLEDDINRMMVVIDRLLTELSDDIRRQSNYVTNERNDLNTLALAIKNGEYFGASLASVGQTTAPPAAATPSRIAGKDEGRRPLIVIRFDRPDVDYQHALYTAVNRALQRQPSASFDLVAVSAIQGGTAKATLNASTTRRNAQAVLRSLTDMGLPPGRVALSATTSPDNISEVRLYLR